MTDTLTAHARVYAAAIDTAAERDRLLTVNAELLAALEWIISRLALGGGGAKSDCIAQARAAIAKATP